MLVQFLINGIITGSVISLLALGFSLVYNTTRIFHIAYAVLYMSAPYLVYVFYNQLLLPLFIAIILAIIVNVLLGVLIELFVYQPLIRKNRSLNVLLISSLGVMIIVINLIALIFGNDSKIINNEISETISIGQIIVTYPQLSQFSISILLIFLFILFIRYSKFGIRTRALRDNAELCYVFGFEIRKFRVLLFALSTFMATICGILISYDVGMDPYVGMPMFLNAVVALIIGGIGRFHAPIIGGFLIGILQSLVIWKFSANWEAAITFSLLILFLILRPQGLFGEKTRLV